MVQKYVGTLTGGEWREKCYFSINITSSDKRIKNMPVRSNFYNARLGIGSFNSMTFSLRYGELEQKTMLDEYIMSAEGTLKYIGQTYRTSM